MSPSGITNHMASVPTKPGEAQHGQKVNATSKHHDAKGKSPVPSYRLLSVCRLRAVLVIILFYSENCIYNIMMVEVRWAGSHDLAIAQKLIINFLR